MALLMIREAAWAALSDEDAERVRSADDVRLGEMPLWIDTRDNSRWRIAHDGRTDFHDNAALLNELAQAPEDRPNAVVLPERPEWMREATDDERAQQTRPGLDSGILLLEPVTARERNSIERILAELWAAIESDELGAGQAQQIQAMAMVLREAQNNAEPNRTKRWQVVGAVRAVLTPTLKLIRTTAAAIKVVEIVRDTGWTDLASDLKDLLQ